MQKLSLVITNN